MGTFWDFMGIWRSDFGISVKFSIGSVMAWHQRGDICFPEPNKTQLLQFRGYQSQKCDAQKTIFTLYNRFLFIKTRRFNGAVRQSSCKDFHWQNLCQRKSMCEFLRFTHKVFALLMTQLAFAETTSFIMGIECVQNQSERNQTCPSHMRLHKELGLINSIVIGMNLRLCLLIDSLWLYRIWILWFLQHDCSGVAACKTVVTLLLIHWSYHSLIPSHGLYLVALND